MSVNRLILRRRPLKRIRHFTIAAGIEPVSSNAVNDSIITADNEINRFMHAPFVH